MVDAEGMMTELSNLLPYGIAIYLILVSIYGYVVMGIDKAKAKKGGSVRRISERHLIGTAMIGGSIGVWLGMRAYRHKTKHAKFVYGVPVVIIAQVALFVWLYSLSR